MIQNVKVLVNNFKENAAKQELEIRIGNVVNNSFVPGVTQYLFDELEKDMNECGTLFPEQDFKELVDYYYVNDKGTPIRTRVEYDTQNMKLLTSHIVKTCKAVVDVDIAESTEAAEPKSACRIALATEEEIESPQVSLLTHVRIKQRKCYTSKCNGFVIWKYELSKTWSASTRDAVEHMQRTMEPRYEVECELIDEKQEYISTHNIDYICDSLIMKIQSLMGWDPQTIIKTIEKKDDCIVSRKRSRKQK